MLPTCGAARFLGELGGGPCQPEVAHLYETVRIQQDVGGLYIPVQHLSRVHVLQAPQHLVAGGKNVERSTIIWSVLFLVHFFFGRALLTLNRREIPKPPPT